MGEDGKACAVRVRCVCEEWKAEEDSDDERCVCVCVNGTRATTLGKKRGCQARVCVTYNSDRADKCSFLKFMLMAL